MAEEFVLFFIDLAYCAVYCVIQACHLSVHLLNMDLSCIYSSVQTCRVYYIQTFENVYLFLCCIICFDSVLSIL